MAICVLVLGTLVCLPQERLVYAEDGGQDVIPSQRLVNGDSYYKTNNVKVGEASGYGDFTLDKENVVLTANPYSNYELVGWLFQMDTNEPIYISETAAEGSLGGGVISHSVDADGNNQVVWTFKQVDFTMTYVYDGEYCTGGTNHISIMAIEGVTDITITPVFDHIYYSIALDNLDEIVDFGDEVNTIDGHTIITKGDAVDNVYQDAVLRTGDDVDNYEYFYVGDVVVDGGKLYTKHYTLEDTPREQLIDIDRGAFRAGDNVDASFDIAFKEDDIKSADSHNVLVYNMKHNGNDMSQWKDGDESGWTHQIHEDYKNSIGVGVKLAVAADINLSVEYNKLHILTLNAKLRKDKSDPTKDEDADWDLINGSMAVTVEGVLDGSYISDNEWFVVEGANPRIHASINVNHKIGESQYSYYTLYSLDGEDANGESKTKDVTNMTADTEIEIVYIDTLYRVDFKFAVLQSNNLDVPDDQTAYNVEETVYLTRGQSIDLERTEDSSNIGYEFKYFSNGSSKIDAITILEERPSSRVVYMAFAPIGYRVKLLGIDTIKLNDGTNDIYPISKAVLKHTAGTETIDFADLRAESKDVAEFMANVNINKDIDITLTVNDGFKINGIKINSANTEYVITGGAGTITLNKEFLSNYTQVIELYIDEAYIEYDFTYKTVPNLDIKLGEDTDDDGEPNGANVIMANISVDTSSLTHVSRSYSYYPYIYSQKDWEDNYMNCYIKSGETYTQNTDPAYDSSKDYYLLSEINLSGLHLYDSLNLVSSARTMPDGTPYVIYRYVNNDGSARYPHAESAGGYTLAFQMKVGSTGTVKVEYSMPSTSLTVELTTNCGDAYNLDEVILESINLDGDRSRLEKNGDTYPIDTGITIEVTLPSEIKFGYRLTGYTITYGSTIETGTIEDGDIVGGKFEFDITSPMAYILTIEVEAIEYQIEVVQYGAGINGSRVQFDGKEFIQAYVNQGLTITFPMPEGHYVGVVKYGAGNEEQSDLAQDNSYEGSEFKIEYTQSQLSSMLEKYSASVSASVYKMKITVEYTVHTYDITVTYVVEGGDKAQILTPKFNLNYGMSQYIESTKTDRKNVFTGVPYNAIAEISLADDIANGLKWTGWSVGEAGAYSSNSQMSLTTMAVKQNMFFNYKVSYIDYDLIVRIVNNATIMGDPRISIKDSSTGNYADKGTKTTVRLYDDFRIAANARKAAGYVFENFYHYTEYVYDAETWVAPEIRSKLYIWQDNQYVKYDSNDHITSYSYFLRTPLGGSNVMTYEDSFKVDNYRIETIDDHQAVVIYVGYTDYLIQFNMITALNDMNGTLQDNMTGLDIAPADYATFAIYADDSDTALAMGNGELKNSTAEAVAAKKVTVEMRFNTIEIDGQSYDLAEAIDVTGVTIFGLDIPFDASEGVWTVTIDLRGTINYMGEDRYLLEVIQDNKFDISFNYLLNIYDVAVTSNIGSDKFYYDNDMKFKMTYDDLVGNLTSNGRNNKTFAQPASQQHFKKASVYYERDNVTNKLKYADYSEYFYVSGVKVYKGTKNNKVLINEDDYDRYGIEVTTGTASFQGGVDREVVTNVGLRVMSDLYIEFQISAMMYFKDGASIDGDSVTFTKDYSCDKDAVGQNQGLIVGVDANADIRMSELMSSYLNDPVYYDEDGHQLVGLPQDAGTYLVSLTFNEATMGDNAWMQSVNLAYNIYLKINPLMVEVIASVPSNETFSKEYDRTSGFKEDISGYLYVKFYDNTGVERKMGINGTTFTLGGYNVDITYTQGGEQISAWTAKEQMYNLYITGIQLSDSDFNSNFALKTSSQSLVINSIIKINRKEIDVGKLLARDKVYDGTDKVYLQDDADFVLDDQICEGDNVTIDINNLSMRYSDYSEGFDKEVVVVADPTSTLAGEGAENYRLLIGNTKTNIYPYSRGIDLDGDKVNDVIIENNAGITDGSKVDLIPIGAEFQVGLIYPDTVEYARIYDYISGYITNRHIFAVGYKLSLLTDGVTSKLPKGLTLKVPTVERMLDVIWNTGELAGDIDYTEQDRFLVIDLGQMDSIDVESVILTQERELLKLWQIILIVGVLAVITASVIVTVVVIKKKREARYSEHDKI